MFGWTSVKTRASLYGRNTGNPFGTLRQSSQTTTSSCLYHIMIPACEFYSALLMLCTHAVTGKRWRKWRTMVKSNPGDVYLKREMRMDLQLKDMNWRIQTNDVVGRILFPFPPSHACHSVLTVLISNDKCMSPLVLLLLSLITTHRPSSFAHSKGKLSQIIRFM